MNKKPKPATAGTRIAFSPVLPGTFGGVARLNLSRRIDAAIGRAVKKERERCARIAICTTDPWVNKYRMIRDGEQP